MKKENLEYLTKLGQSHEIGNLVRRYLSSYICTKPTVHLNLPLSYPIRGYVCGRWSKIKTYGIYSFSIAEYVL